MIKASIDIGTNSVLLLIAEVNSDTIQPLAEQQQIPRLGRGVDHNKNLSHESRQRVLDVLLKYKKYLQKQYPSAAEEPVVTATSAVRDAVNRSEFLNEIKKKTGWVVQILSGDDEAKVTFKGALSVIQTDEKKSYAVIDIGGGSTELIFGNPRELKSFTSVDMGSVRFSERYLLSNPPEPEQIDNAKKEIARLFNTENLPGKDFIPVGVAGTVTSLAAIDAGISSYKANILNGYILKKVRIEQFIDEFSVTPAEMIEQRYPDFLHRRGDVILAGALILNEFLNWISKDEIVISTGGIRHGILLSRLNAK